MSHVLTYPGHYKGKNVKKSVVIGPHDSVKLRVLMYETPHQKVFGIITLKPVDKAVENHQGGRQQNDIR